VRVLEALLELVEEGELRPTAQEVAERAGVALRTVYHHFEDVSALRTMALRMQTDRYRETLRVVDPKLPLDERIAQTARQYRKLFEAITPIRLATMFDQHDSPEMAEGLRQARAQRREHLAATFSAELGRRSEEGRTLLDALDLVTSWDTWNYLRSSLGRSAPAAEKVVMLMLNDLFTTRRAAPAKR
jgi:TetR/AcrR family transcriptional regulator of autoinduction and epiphytic fitness